MNIFQEYTKYRKSIAAFIIGLAGVAAVVWPLVSDGNVSVGDTIAIVAAVASWLGGTGAVYGVSNEPEEDKGAKQAPLG